jgi:hypothetical protein
MMTIENVRVPIEDRERDPVLKDMSEKGWTLIAVADDGWSHGRVGFHYWSLYFTRATERELRRTKSDHVDG